MSGRKNVMIVLAAGQGKRMGRPYPKMLIPVRGKPLLHWSLQNLERCSSIDAVILAVPPEWRGEFERKMHFKKYSKISAVVSGGKERTDSTRKAMKALPGECEWVGVHDAARPCAAPQSIQKCFAAAKRAGAAILAVPATDTVKLVSKNMKVLKTVPRGQCWTAQTPQIFSRKIAEKLHGRARPSRFTDDASIAESLGCEVAVVAGSAENIKVTTPKDLLAVEIFLRKRKLA